MKPPPQPSGLNRGLGVLIPEDWTPEQAQAVVDVLDDLRERLWGHYALPLHERSSPLRTGFDKLRASGKIQIQQHCQGERGHSG